MYNCTGRGNPSVVSSQTELGSLFEDFDRVIRIAPFESQAAFELEVLARGGDDHLNVQGSRI